MRNLAEALSIVGKSHSDIDAILITHEHHDHISNLRAIAKKADNSKVIATIGTLRAIESRQGRFEEGRSVSLEWIANMEAFSIGDILVKPFPLSHDAVSPVGFTLTYGDEKIGIVTDTGEWNDVILQEVKEADLLVLEANHDRNVLMMGTKYPYELKKRILGKMGHLSNEDSASLVSSLLMERKKSNPPTVALAHLSQENNTPDLARVTVANILFESNFIEGRDYHLEVLPPKHIWRK